MVLITIIKILTAYIMKPIRRNQLFTESCLSLLVTPLSFAIRPPTTFKPEK